MAVKAGKKAAVFITGSGLSFTTEATTSSDNKNYQMTSATKRIWDRTATISVFDGGSPVSATTYTVNRLNGTITFATATSRTITVTGTYLPTTEIGIAKGVSYTISANNEDITAFGEEYVNRKQALLDFTASLGAFYTDDTYQSYLTAGTAVVLEVYADDSVAYDIRAWVIPSSNDQSGAVDGIVEESMEFEGTTDADKRCLTLT